MVVNNPNNWHWVDKNCLEWSRNYFKEKLTGLSVSSSSGDVTAKISGVSSVEGDVDVSQRKGKVISLFDIRMVLNLSGKAGEKDASGSITIPEIAYDSSPEDYQFDISIYSEDAETRKVRDLAREKLVPEIRKILYAFGPDLIVLNSVDIQHPPEQVSSKLTLESQKSVAELAKVRTDKVVENEVKKTAAINSTSTTSSEVSKYNTSTLHLEPTFNTTAEMLYDTLLKPELVQMWTRHVPDIAPEEGRNFSLFGGNIEGKITKLEKNKTIEMLWRLKDWKKGHYANMKLALHQGDGETTLKVFWDGIPVGQEEATQSNFEEYYVKAIKVTFGFGAVL